MLKFFFAPHTVSLATLIALEEVGANYDLHRIDFASNDQRSDAYLAVNPKGRVPALVSPKGIVTETPALLEYIAEAHPEAGLLPETAFERAKMREMCSYLASTVHVAHAHRLRQARWSDDESTYASMAAKVPSNIADCCAILEDAITGPWILQQYSAADPYLFTICSWLAHDSVDIANYPKLAAHQAAMSDRPAVKRALEIQ